MFQKHEFVQIVSSWGSAGVFSLIHTWHGLSGIANATFPSGTGVWKREGTD